MLGLHCWKGKKFGSFEKKIGKLPKKFHSPIALGRGTVNLLRNLFQLYCPHPKLSPTSSYLTRLNFFNLEGSLITEIPETIGNIKNVNELTVVDNDFLKSISAAIGRLRMMKNVTISPNLNLKKLPSPIGQLDNVREFRILINRKLERIPAEIGRLYNLEICMR